MILKLDTNLYANILRIYIFSKHPTTRFCWYRLHPWKFHWHHFSSSIRYSISIGYRYETKITWEICSKHVTNIVLRAVYNYFRAIFNLHKSFIFNHKKATRFPLYINIVWLSSFTNKNSIQRRHVHSYYDHLIEIWTHLRNVSRIVIDDG